MKNQSEFQKELASLINRYSEENISDTPDYVLAEYLQRCLDAYNFAIAERKRWYVSKSSIK